MHFILIGVTCGSHHMQIGFGGWPSSPWRQLPYPQNQRVAPNSKSAVVGQPLVVSKVAHCPVRCHVRVLVQQKGNYWKCGGSYCTGVSLTFKKQVSHPALLWASPHILVCLIYYLRQGIAALGH